MGNVSKGDVFMSCDMVPYISICTNNGELVYWMVSERIEMCQKDGIISYDKFFDAKQNMKKRNF